MYKVANKLASSKQIGNHRTIFLPPVLFFSSIGNAYVTTIVKPIQRIAIAFCQERMEGRSVQHRIARLSNEMLSEFKWFLPCMEGAITTTMWKGI